MGGFDRLRAFPSHRFNDQSAFYSSAELRLVPRYQPLRDLALLRYFEIDFWQLVPFVEVGRVGEHFNTDLLVSDLHVDAGLSLRLMAFRAIVRLDWAVSEEGNAIWAMYSHPFGRQGQ